MTRNFVQKNTSVLLRAVADMTQSKIGEAMGGHDASYVSRFFKGDQKISCDEMIALMDACGLALHRVGEEDMIVATKDWKRMVGLAKLYMAQLED